MKTKKLALKALSLIGVIAFWFCIWALVSFQVNSELLFPSPMSVIKALASLAVTAEFWLITLHSLMRVVAGIAVSLILGALLAVITEKIAFLKALLSPILGVIKATPIASFIILAMLWLTKGFLPIFITSLIVVPIVWSNVSEGIRSVDPNLKEVAQVYNLSFFDKLKKLYVPSVTPFFMAACRSSLGMAWKAGISAEVLSTPQSAIGTELYFAKTYLETPSLFAWTAMVIIMSVIIEKLFVSGLGKLGSKLHVIPKGGDT